MGAGNYWCATSSRHQDKERKGKDDGVLGGATEKSAPGLANEDNKPNLNLFSLSNDLPGLESVVANEARNELWVKGTAESIGNLKEIFDFLDKPVRQLEIKTQIVEVDAAEVSGPGRFTDLAVGKTPDPTMVQNTLIFEAEFPGKIKGLTAMGKAKVLHASQTTVSNNSTARVRWDENPISQRVELQAGPTIQHDNTITLFLTLKIGEVVLDELKNLSSRRQSLFTVANIRDDIVALRLDHFETVRSEDERRVTLLLVSARILEDK